MADKEKISMPDGRGGYIQMEADKFSDGATANIDKQQQKLDEEKKKAHEDRVGKAAEKFNKFHKAYAMDHGITGEEIVKAAYLELLNLKEFYPSELGGPARVDELCGEVYTWFEKNKNLP